MRVVLVPYVVSGEPVEVSLPSWFERHIWWRLAWGMADWEQGLLWRVWDLRPWPLRPVSAFAGWLITHTPWWGGPGISRPEIWRRRDEWETAAR